MINATEGYRAAIVGTSRRTHLKAVVDISDPDMVFSGVESSGSADFSNSAQLYDRVMDLTPYATLEPHRWVLNGKFSLIPAEGAADQVGFVGNVLSGSDGSFPTAVWWRSGSLIYPSSRPVLSTFRVTIGMGFRILSP